MKPVDVGAAGDRRRPLAEQRHRHVAPGILLQLAGDRLALLERGGQRPVVAQLLVQVVLGPAEPAGLAIGGVGDEADRIVEALARAPGDEDVPAALGDRLLDRAPGDDRAPVGGGELGIDAGLLQPLGNEQRGIVHEGDVGRLQDDDRAAVVAGLLEQLRGLGDVLPALEPVGIDIALHQAGAGKQRSAGAVVFRVAEHRLEDVLLLDEVQHGLARLDLVEGRVQPVEPAHADVAALVQDVELDVLVALELVQQVDRRDLVEVDLAGLQGRHRRLLVGHVLDDDAIDLGDLAADHAGRRLLARHVVRVPVVDVALARFGLVLVELEGAGADLGRHLLVGVRLRVLLAHDDGQVGLDLAERLQHQAIGLLKDDLEGLVVLDGRVGDPLEHVLGGAVAGGPAADRGDDIGAGDGLPVVELQAVAQRERIGLLVVGDAPLVDHLRLDVAIVVQSEQRVVDQQTVVAGHVGGGPDRIEDLEIAVQHGANRARLGRCGLCLEQAGGRYGSSGRHAAFDERTAGRSHWSPPPTTFLTLSCVEGI